MDNSSLLAPITAEQPAGVDVSFSPEIDAIQEMRREDDPTLDQGEWVAALKSADWAGVAQSCEAILASRSKDLRVAGWLVDARARREGFVGLAEGIELVAALVDTYWSQVHPLPDDDGDQEQRIGNLRWLGTRIEQLAPVIPLFTLGGRRTNLTAVSGARTRRLAIGVGNVGSGDTPDPTSPTPEPLLTLETVLRDFTAAGREAARARRSEVTRARDAMVALKSSVDAALKDDAPSFAGAKAAIDRALDELGRLERECGFSETSAVDDLTSGAEASSATPDAPVNGTLIASARVLTRIETRSQAVQQLRLIASYFRSTEPHSPVAYLADKAVRWADMPLHEWLRAVVKDGVSLSQLEDLLGVDKKPGDV